jgi:hypothetical protein
MKHYTASRAAFDTGLSKSFATDAQIISVACEFIGMAYFLGTFCESALQNYSACIAQHASIPMLI